MKIKGLEDVWKRLWEKLKKNKYVLAVMLLGVILLLLPTGGRGSGSTASGNTSTFSEVVFSLEEQEKRLSEMLSAVEGAGETEVMLTLKTSTEQILAQDAVTASADRSGETEVENSISTVIISSGSGLESTVTLKYIYPEYLGAIVVSEGAANASVKLALTRAIAAATGLSSDKITVIKMKNS